MKFKDFKNFREYDRKFVKVTNIDEIIKKDLKIEKLEEPLFGIMYIDRECGVSLRILGDEYNEINEESIIIRAGSFDDIYFEIFEGTDFLKDVLENQIIRFYYDDNIIKLLSDERLDEFRHEVFPEDVLAILLNDNQLEKMWVRLCIKTNEENIYVAELLDDSYVNNNYKVGNKVALVLHEEDDFRGLIIKGLVEKI